MNLNPRSIAGLSQAIKENRQLTMSERMQAGEVLAAIRKEVLAHFGLQAAAKPEHGDAEIDRKLKKRELFEVARYFDQEEGPSELRPLVKGLLREALNDYARASWHKRAVARPEPAAPEPSYDMSARLAQIELRLAALESACVVDDEGDRASFAALNARIDELENLRVQGLMRVKALEALIHPEVSDNEQEKKG